MSNLSGAATSGPNEGPATVKQTIVASIEAPRLTDITTEAFAIFKEKRATYERQVDEKNTDPGTQIAKTTYRNSVEQAVLDVLTTAQWVPVCNIEEITEEHIKDCVANRAEISVQAYDAEKIEQDIKEVKMEAADKDTNLEKQVWTLCLKYTNTLRKCGYKDFISKRPKQAVKHVAKRITHPQLRDRMRTVLGTEQEELQNDFHSFIRMLAAEARSIEKLESAKFYVASLEAADSSDSDIAGHRPTSEDRRNSWGKKNYRKNKGNNYKVKPSSQPNNDSRNPRRKRDAPPLPKCLNPLCKEYHFVRDCPISSEADKKRLKEEYHQNKRRKRAGKVGKIGADAMTNHTSLFLASFFDGAVKTVAMADQGSDANVINNPNHCHHPVIKTLERLAGLRRQWRYSRGRAVQNTGNERRIQDVAAHLIVDEMMISANMIGGKIARSKGIPVLYRGVSCIWWKSRDMEKGANVQLDVRPLRHVGLGLDEYVQVTSPIRNFSDLIFHCQLNAMICKQTLPFSEKDLLATQDKVLKLEQASARIERRAKKYWAYQHLMKDGLKIHRGVIRSKAVEWEERDSRHSKTQLFKKVTWRREQGALWVVFLRDLGCEITASVPFWGRK